MNKNIFKLIISAVFIFTVLIGWGFISTKDVKAAVWCMQCKCTYDDYHERSFYYDDGHGVCDNASCLAKAGSDWTRVKSGPDNPAHKPECDGNCNRECVDGGGNNGGSSCGLEKKSPNNPSNDACASCLIPQMRGEIDYVKTRNPTGCTDREALSHLCNGGIDQANIDRCVSFQQTGSACGTACGGGTGDNGSGQGWYCKDDHTIWYEATTGERRFECTCNPNGPANNDCTGGICESKAPTSSTRDAHCVPGTPSSTGTPTVAPTAITTGNPTATSTPIPTPTTKTSFYRVSDKLFQADDTNIEWKDYTAEPMAFDWLFKNAKVGDNLTLFAQFKADNGQTSDVFRKSIKYVGADPKISSIACSYDPSGIGTLITINGSNLGSEQGNGTVTLPTEQLNASILSWGDIPLPPTASPTETVTSTPTGVCEHPAPPAGCAYFGQDIFPTCAAQLVCTTIIPTCIPRPACLDARPPCLLPEPADGWCPPSAPTVTDIPANESTNSTTPVLGASIASSKIVAKVDTRLAEGRHTIKVVTSDGRVAPLGTCNIGLTTVDFTQKSACLAKSADLSADNVAIDITEKVDKAKSIVKTKIKMDKDGKPTGFTPKLEIGKTYILTIRAPKTVSKKVEFTAEEGTTNLDDIILPVGDIFPVASPDNKVNAFDKAEMTREWALNTDVTRAADLNGDSRVNSVDYSCLQNNYNKSGD